MSVDEQYEAFAVAAWPRLVRAARLLGLRPDDAEDAAQATLVACYARWKRMDKLAVTPYGYAYTALLNRIRSRGRGLREVLMADPPDSEGHPPEPHGWLVEALMQLSPTHREVVVCRYYLDMSEAETSRVLGIPAGTAKSRLHRALQQLDHVLAEERTER